MGSSETCGLLALAVDRQCFCWKESPHLPLLCLQIISSKSPRSPETTCGGAGFDRRRVTLQLKITIEQCFRVCDDFMMRFSHMACERVVLVMCVTDCCSVRILPKSVSTLHMFCVVIWSGVMVLSEAKKVGNT